MSEQVERFADIDPATGGEVTVVSGWRDEDGRLHIDREPLPQFVLDEPAPPGYTETSGREIMDAVAEFYRRNEPGPALPERISVHPGEMPAFADLAQREGRPQAPWAAGHVAGLTGVPVVSDPQAPPGVARIRTDGHDRDVPLRSPAPGRFTAPVTGWYEVNTPSAEQLAESSRALRAMGERARSAADGFAPLVESMRTAAQGLHTAVRQAVPDPELDAAKHWPAPSRAVCAHVCGPDAGHSCEAKAATSLRFTLPSGGIRDLPLCEPCASAENATGQRGILGA